MDAKQFSLTGQLTDKLVRKLIQRTTGINFKWEDISSEKELMGFFETAAAMMIALESPNMMKIKSITQIFEKFFKKSPQKSGIDEKVKKIESVLNILFPDFTKTTLKYCFKNRLASFVCGIPAAILMLSVTKLIFAVGQFLKQQTVLKRLTERLAHLEKQIGRLQEITSELNRLIVKYAEEKSASYNTPLFNRIEALFGEAKKLLYSTDLRGQLSRLRTDLENARRNMGETKGKLQTAAIGGYSAGSGMLLLSWFMPVLTPFAVASFSLGVTTGTAAVYYDRQTEGQMRNVEQELKKLHLYDLELQQTAVKIEQLEKEHRKVVEAKKKEKLMNEEKEQENSSMTEIEIDMFKKILIQNLLSLLSL